MRTTPTLVPHSIPLPWRQAAMYVRMSTDHQKYSIENQAAAIEEYAAQHHIQIAKIYTDSGKSGLSLGGRDALQQLIKDVQYGEVEFSIILVLDVTRWGRFQDADESAYYEYICRKAGIDVEYVGEQFQNDGSPASTIFKSVKRTMAGEYSRELSNKVFAGQCRLIEKGFKQGGPAGYGLRRLLIDEYGNPKAELKRGEHKSLITDRVILVPGAAKEIEHVHWIYKAFTQDGLNESEIAADLNRQGILTDLGRAWTRSVVHQVLTNEKYIGNSVFNRISFKLKKRRVFNPPENWVRHDGAFEGIVDPSLFYTVQGILSERSRKLSDEDMLGRLKDLYERKGWLSAIIINESEGMPPSTAYSHRFGSLLRAYELIGYSPEKDYSFIEINRKLRQLHAGIMEDVMGKIIALGTSVTRDDEDILNLHNELRVSVVICRHQETAQGSRWKLHLDTGLLPDITVAVRMDASNEQPLDYYLIPALDVENPKLRLSETNGLALDAYRFDDLEGFFLLTKRVPLKEIMQ